MQTGNRYVLHLTDVPEILRVRFVTFSLKPRARSPYLLHVESARGIVVPDRTGSTAAAGPLIESIPPDAIRAELWFGAGPNRETCAIDLAQVRPVDSTTGIQSCLRNLSYLDNSAIRGQLDAPTIDVLVRFQADNQLSVTGQPDAPTRARLEEVYLS